MSKISKAGFPFVGALFLALGVLKLVQGENWVVWAILGVLFGGLGIFSWKRSDGDES